MGYRTLTIRDETWEYILGKEGVKIRDPQGKCTWVRKYIFLGLTKEQYIAEIHKHFDADDDFKEIIALTPGIIKEYILKQKEK